ncbi:hypothetical protein [Pseudorhodoferax sp.]|uniref:hypothetical protein n=1 Tax=Pseudorhodoferax sp. TaxID=1993553 RepID=UPI002DD6214F|nr:hypothetical protein [Pseudorhodoferax sp.]
MIPYAHVLATLLLALAAALAPARAQQFDVQPRPPSRIVVQVHESVVDDRFVAEVEQRLRAMFMAPVDVVPGLVAAELLLPGDYGRVNGTALLDAMAASIDWERDAGAYHVLLIAPEIRLVTDRFNFSVSMGGLGARSRVGVVSLGPLQKLGSGRLDQAPHRTASRVAKLVARSIVRTSGYPESGNCLHHLPSSLAVMDALPESYCEPDLTAWTAAGLLRAAPR